MDYPWTVFNKSVRSVRNIQTIRTAPWTVHESLVSTILSLHQFDGHWIQSFPSHKLEIPNFLKFLDSQMIPSDFFLTDVSVHYHSHSLKAKMQNQADWTRDVQKQAITYHHDVYNGTARWSHRYFFLIFLRFLLLRNSLFLQGLYYDII